ncbi:MULTISPECIES: spore germination protein GerPB [Cohnella]|uniref:Spore germination protein GerPB n=1 Tax=Cohnella rhizosphaerae TaxID=1457232 RepID=A0A9X4KZC5_9BACL|nr:MULTISPECIES: spore germination protein GerPB [Cohnella]MDG0813226.1 spore germination protein GerPB [Cohnella rhizosphaerae]
MSLTIYQHIAIGQLRVDAVSNSSVLQIGSAGNIQSLSQLYNTGGFTEPAAQLTEETVANADSPLALVPLPNPT